jgi:hypothetical protein
MTSGLHSLIAREGGAGGGGRRKRTRGPRRRPSYIAHPAAWWPAETTADHLTACRTGRGPDGEWKPHEELSEAEKWALFWEFSVTECGIIVGGGPAIETEVP